LHEFCTDFDKIDAKIKAVVAEKESLEKVLLELAGFSESCDDRFDQIIDKITKFSDQDRKEFEEMKNGHELIRVQLSDTVKNIIVEIEDHAIRDELLSVLTDINDKPLNLTVGQLVEKLVQRMRDLHLKNKRLYTINTEQAREAKQAQEQLTGRN
jgi:archaellum biogenesis ATPase FlaH